MKIEEDKFFVHLIKYLRTLSSDRYESTLEDMVKNKILTKTLAKQILKQVRNE